MIKKVDLGSSLHHGVFGNPAPLGLFGLAVSCAVLTPTAFGYGIADGKIMAPAFATTLPFLFYFSVLLPISLRELWILPIKIPMEALFLLPLLLTG